MGMQLTGTTLTQSREEHIGTDRPNGLSEVLFPPTTPSDCPNGLTNYTGDTLPQLRPCQKYILIRQPRVSVHLPHPRSSNHTSDQMPYPSTRPVTSSAAFSSGGRFSASSSCLTT